ncbi:hypothetical protein FHL15_009847 [Xylaria flabelliformis]|uniref:Uncharacterized protein n=1 Tax=Xylaria flabelliformis TaxID=2512241 RepID=A0A553HMT9_9PEZI|nr:hypothetical protein FHL15_009847 [Xylaria flabelliformis]
MSDNAIMGDQSRSEIIIPANGIDLEQTNGAGSKPLYLAVDLGSSDIVVLLRQAGADVESFNTNSQVCWTVFQQAVDGDRTEIAELLLQHGADVNSIDPGDFKSAAGLTGSHDRHHRTPTNPSTHMRSTRFSLSVNDNMQRPSALANQATLTRYLLVVKKKPTGAKKFKSNTMANAADPGDPAQWSAVNSQSLYNHLIRGCSTPESLGEAGALQTCRTLDQYLNTYLDTRNRDRDQIID